MAYSLKHYFSALKIILASLCGPLRSVYCKAHRTFDGETRGKQHTFCTVTAHRRRKHHITTIEFIHQRMKWGFSQTNTIQFWQAWPESWIELWRASCWDKTIIKTQRNIAKYSHHDSLDIINFHLFMVCFGWTELIITICFTWHWDSCWTRSILSHSCLNILIMLAAVPNCVWCKENQI